MQTDAACVLLQSKENSIKLQSIYLECMKRSLTINSPIGCTTYFDRSILVRYFLRGKIPCHRIIASCRERKDCGRQCFTQLCMIQFFIIQLPHQYIGKVGRLTNQRFQSGTGTKVQLQVARSKMGKYTLFTNFSGKLEGQYFLLP